MFTKKISKYLLKKKIFLIPLNLIWRKIVYFFYNKKYASLFKFKFLLLILESHVVLYLLCLKFVVHTFVQKK